jgi:TonB-linked SusC/RagA family outer membrane protein
MKKCSTNYCKCLLFLSCCIPVFLFAQTKKITGTVTDNKAVALSNVSVRIKNSDKGTVTDDLGHFSITANAGDKIEISSVNFESETIPVITGKTNYIVLLKAKSNTLEDVVVIGYGTQKKKDITGSIVKAPITDMLKAPVASFDQALAGRVAGVQVVSSDGQPGSSINIVIRGANSVSQGNSPLYVIDGFPIENPENNAISPEDIESMDVLKDASATAIYGARGANGVIIITTKKGKIGDPVVSFNSYYGVQKDIKRMKLMTPYEYVKYQLEVNPSQTPYVQGSGNILTPYQTYLSGGTTLGYYKDTAALIDWQGQVFQTAPMLSNSISVTGGTSKTQYAISGNIFNQNGIIINSGYNRYQGRVVLDQTVNSKLKVGVNVNYSYLVQSGTILSQSTNSATRNIMYSVWAFRPVNPSAASAAFTGLLTDLNQESLTDPTVPSTNDYRFNPIVNLNNLYRKNKTTDLMANAYLEYNIVPNLVLRVTGGIENRLFRNEAFNNSQTSYGNPLLTSNGPNGSITFNEFSTWLNENYLTYNKVFHDDHSLTILAGMTEQGNNTASYGVSAINVPNESLGINALSQGTPLTITSTASLWTAASFLGRINYSYKSRYLFTASYRVDGSSKFSPENHWGYFPSGAVAWKFSQEKFMTKYQNIISDGKLRVSYGNTANNRVSDFAYLPVYSQTPSYTTVYTFNNVPITGAVPITIGNEKLKWETTSQLDIGLDLGILKNRVSLTADIYRKNTTNLLLNATVPSSSGYNSVYENIGSVRNQGLELAINSTNIQNKNFTWTTSFNISFNQSKVLSLANNQETLLSSLAWDNGWTSTPGYIAKVGQPMGLMYGYIWDGVYQYQDFDKTTAGTYILKNSVTTNGNTRANIQPGDIKYKDINGDGVVNANDYTVIGRSLPKYIGGFTNNLTYKNFDLSIFFQWSYGNDIQNINNLVFSGNGKIIPSPLNQFASYENRWTATNTNTTQFRAGGYYGGGYSSKTVEDGSFLRLKTLSLGYNLSSALLKKLKINKFRLYTSMQNVFNWTKYSGQDPEVNTYNSVLTGGVDYSSFPRARTITLGLNASF